MKMRTWIAENFLSSLCLLISGIKSVPAIYTNIPRAIGTRTCWNSWAKCPILNVIITPMTALRAVKKFNNNALFLLYPPWRSTAKSPISCGISWRRIAKEVPIPAGTEIKKLAPMTIPSIKLWTKSPTKLICAKAWWWVLSFPWWQWFQWRSFSVISPIKTPPIIHNPIASADSSW